jgi:succinyl-CoA synthetase beta subunit
VIVRLAGTNVEEGKRILAQTTPYPAEISLIMQKVLNSSVASLSE